MSEDSLENFFIAVSPEQQKKERQKARELRATQWWKQKLGQGLCYYCGGSFSKDELSMDHKVPVVRGGRTSKSNVVVSCKSCNSQKKYLTDIEFKQKLAQNP